MILSPISLYLFLLHLGCIRQVALFDACARCFLGDRWVPRTAAWVTSTLDKSALLVVGTVSGPLQVLSSDGAVLQQIWVHGQDTTVTALVFNATHQCILSGDERGMLQMWDCHGDYDTETSITRPNEESGVDSTPSFTTTVIRLGAPVTARRNGVQFTSRLDTQLLHLHQKSTYAVSMAVSPTGGHYAVYGADARIRLFKHETGMLLCTYDERLKVYDQQHGLKPYHLDELEYGRRAALEREIMSKNSNLNLMQLQFEETEGKYLFVPTLMGLKVIDWKRHKLVKLVGAADAAQQRFVGLLQCAGSAVVDSQLQLARQQEPKDTAATPVVAQSEPQRTAAATDAKKVTDALMIVWAYQSRRFFVFSHVDPTRGDHDADTDVQGALIRRDHWNEQPDAADTAAAALATTGTVGAPSRLASNAVIHTTMGDIHVQLFGTQTPMTVENFATHARNEYYDELLFHRVIKGFMLQTGDPNGDGTGGEVSRSLTMCMRTTRCVRRSYFDFFISCRSFYSHGRAYGEVNSPTKLFRACAMTDPLPFPWRMQDRIPMVLSSLSRQSHVPG